MTEPIHLQRFNSGRILPPGLPFPEGVRVGSLLFLSGVIGHLPGQLGLPVGGIAAEARRAVRNIRVVLQGQGLDLGDLVRCTVMLADMAEWSAFNEVWRDEFGEVPLPARSAFGCQGLALGARVEIECIAAVPAV
jgi:2-iminobutanoate/2-iminopropanoate deaminase